MERRQLDRNVQKSHTLAPTHPGWEEGRYLFGPVFLAKVRATWFGSLRTSECAHLKKVRWTVLHPPAQPAIEFRYFSSDVVSCKMPNLRESGSQRIQPYPPTQRISKFDLTVEFTGHAGRLTGAVSNTARTVASPSERVERNGWHFTTPCAEDHGCNPIARILGDLELLERCGKAQVSGRVSNHTQVGIARKDKCLH